MARKIETVNSLGWVEALNEQGLSEGTEILLIGEDRALKRIMRILSRLRRLGLQIEYCMTKVSKVEKTAEGRRPWYTKVVKSQEKGGAAWQAWRHRGS